MRYDDELLVKLNSKDYNTQGYANDLVILILRKYIILILGKYVILILANYIILIMGKYIPRVSGRMQHAQKIVGKLCRKVKHSVNPEKLNLYHAQNEISWKT